MDKNKKAEVISSKEQKAEKFTFCIIYKVNRQSIISSKLKSMGCEILKRFDSKNCVMVRVNMSQLAEIKRLNCIERVEVIDNNKMIGNVKTLVLKNFDKNSVISIEHEAVDAQMPLLSNTKSSGNTMQTAISLPLSTYVIGSICRPGAEMWYKFTPLSTAYYTIHTVGSLDTVGHVYDANVDMIDSDDDAGMGMNFKMVACLTAGQTYYIKTSAYGSNTGHFSIAVTNKVFVESVIINPYSVSLTKGESVALTATVTPSYATHKKLYWETSDSSVATVSQSGVVTAIGTGKACICVYSQDGTSKRCSCVVYVKPPITVKGCDNYTMNIGDTVYLSYLSYDIYSSNMTALNATWYSSNPNVAKVNRLTGEVTAKSAGTTIITITTDDNSYTASCEIWVKGKTPVFLIHGRTSNSKYVWGINNNIPSGQNDHFNLGINALSLNGKKYTDINSQTLGSFEPDKGKNDTDKPCNLGNKLIDAGYEKNINLFAFNYPNEDAVKYSAQKFKTYINNLILYVRTSGTDEMKACFYESRSDYNNNNYKINIVGHSMGGLIARYYIENLYQDIHVDKLITICTPHWGSKYHYLSNTIGFFHVLGDHDLSLDSAMYGGSNSKIVNCDKITCHKGKCTVTPKLQYKRQRTTKYYAIAGIDYDVANVNLNDYTFEMPTNFTTSQEITDYLVNKNIYKLGGKDLKVVSKPKLKSIGDNMVGFLSQIGWIGDNDNVNTPKPKIQMERIFIYVDTNSGNYFDGGFVWEVLYGFAFDALHSKVPHRIQVCDKVIEYLEN